jgi:NAD(P)-dependent dehydrogenase (short-subunit alcohol dehydrogenase family)
MKNIVIIGASHGIGEKLAQILDTNYAVYSYSRTQGEGNWQSWKHDEQINVDHLPDIIHGCVYAPGTINLRPFHLLKESDFRHDFEVNFLGAVKVLQAFYPKLKKSENASVILFSTVAVAKGMSFHTSIAAAKGAIEGFVKSIAIEWAPTIRVNAIAPSLVETPLSNKITSSQQVLEATIQKHPLKRIGKVDDIASLARFLLSEESSWITGQVIHVDGGMSVS